MPTPLHPGSNTAHTAIRATDATDTADAIPAVDAARARIDPPALPAGEQATAHADETHALAHQSSLFGSAFDADPLAIPDGALLAAPADGSLHALTRRLGPRLHLGTSSWHFPGWQGFVWGRRYDKPTLSQRGLTAYSRHPLLRTVSVDRGFYRPLDAATCATMAAQVPDDFRFVVKAPAAVTDATLREASNGRPTRDNPLFLDPGLAVSSAVQPAAAGFGGKLGVLVFQLSPLPPRWLSDPAALFDRLGTMLAACRAALPSDRGWIAVEVRDASLLTAELAALLKRHGARYCLGLHDRMPSVDEQLPMLRALWPGPLICRWNLQRGLRYEQARGLFAPFDRLRAPDPATRRALARAALGTLAAGHAAFITINNKAEGSAPKSVVALADAVAQAADEAGVSARLA